MKRISITNHKVCSIGIERFISYKHPTPYHKRSHTTIHVTILLATILATSLCISAFVEITGLCYGGNSAQNTSNEPTFSKPVFEHWGVKAPPPETVPKGISVTPSDYWMEQGYKLKKSIRKASAGDLPLEIKISEEALKDFYFALHHDPASTKIALTIAREHTELGTLHVSNEDPRRAFENFKKALILYEKISEQSSSQAELTTVKKEVTAIHEYLGKCVAAIKQANVKGKSTEAEQGNLSERKSIDSIAKHQPSPSKEVKKTPTVQKKIRRREIANPRTRIYARELLSGFYESDRKKAAKELGKSGDLDAVEPLAEALQTDRDQNVRKEAAKSLGKLASPKAIPALGRAVLNYNNDEEVRKEAAKSLGEIGDPAAVDVLGRALRNDILSKRVRAQAADSLGSIGSRKAIPYLRDALSDRSGTVRDHVRKALKKILEYK